MMNTMLGKRSRREIERQKKKNLVYWLARAHLLSIFLRYMLKWIFCHSTTTFKNGFQPHSFSGQCIGEKKWVSIALCLLPPLSDKASLFHKSGDRVTSHWNANKGGALSDEEQIIVVNPQSRFVQRTELRKDDMLSSLCVQRFGP